MKTTRKYLARTKLFRKQNSWWLCILIHPAVMTAVSQCCQLSCIIQETPDFGPYLPVSRSESVISWIIAKVAISCRLDFPTIRCQIFCIVWATVNMECFLINSGMHCNLSNNEAKYELFMFYIHWSESTSILAQMMSFVVQYDIIYHSFPINSQYLMAWGVDSPVSVS